MELFIFARFRAKEGQEGAVAMELRATAAATRPEPGCLAMALFRSVRDPRLFWLHSRWLDEAAFEIHVGLPRVAAFVERVQQMIDHPLDVTRTHLVT
jgi:quinol monooxygenase YgiN